MTLVAPIPSLARSICIHDTRIEIDLNQRGKLLLSLAFIDVLGVNKVKDDLPVYADFSCQRIEFFYLKLLGVVNHFLKSVEMDAHFFGYGGYRYVFEDVAELGYVAAFD